MNVIQENSFMDHLSYIDVYLLLFIFMYQIK